MHLQLIVAVLYCAISVPTLCNDDDDYDIYEYEEVSTIPTSKTSRKAKKKQTRNQVYSIEEFLNTEEKIWVYKSTRKSGIMCSVDVMHEVNMLYADMTRYQYSSSDGLTNVTARAMFDFHPLLGSSEDPYNEMRIRNTANNNPFETIIFKSTDSTCGLFYINYHSENTFDRNAWFELRLWNSSLVRGPDEKCLSLFNEYTSRLNITYNYTTSCQCIISRRLQSTTPDEN
uniref:Putative group i salivary lipocalin n=1 Tax=Rhipicephalus pulchellus TaxID=72859 RepID=L7LRF8_RHIPC